MFRQFMSLALAIVFSASVVAAETNGAMMHATGQALLNGAIVHRSSAVLKGDVVQAPGGAAVSINSKGSAILLPGESRVKFQGNSIDLQAGHAVITTSSGFKAQVDTISVVPSQKVAKFEVSRQDGKVMIAALNGAVGVSDATHSMVVPEGSVATLDPQEQENDNDRRRRGAAAPIETSGWGISKKVAIGLGIAGGAAAGIIAWQSTDSPPEISGSNP